MIDKDIPSERKLIARIAQMKWGRAQAYFKCKGCGNKKNNKINYPYSLKCTKCNKVDRLFVGTAFKGSRMSVRKKLAILEELKNKFPQRLTVSELSYKLKIEEKTISNFFKSLAVWCPMKFNPREYKKREEHHRGKAMMIDFFQNLLPESKNIYVSVAQMIADYTDPISLSKTLERLVFREFYGIYDGDDGDDIEDEEKFDSSAGTSIQLNYGSNRTPDY